jgi:anti-sigma regulatory factor (Ser/Thr protein kinase)
MTESPTFHHEAFFYADADEFLAGTVPFVQAGLAADEAVLAALPAEKLELLRGALGADAAWVELVAMEEIGRNPARIISAWHDFLAANHGPERGVRGIGEPIWAGRSGPELDECRRHESLLNLAFGEGPAWPLICPYDSSRLDDEVLLAAEHNHPVLSGERARTAEYGTVEDTFGGRLEEPDGDFAELVFDVDGLPAVRRLVLAEAARAGIEPGRAGDLVLATSEIANNSVHHGGGVGILQTWRSKDSLICEVRDSGRIADPLVGRKRPRLDQLTGRGLWLANQLCDLVQIRWEGETVVRLRMSAP